LKSWFSSYIFRSNFKGLPKLALRGNKKTAG
jgi:hypothetical protein